MLLSSPQIGSTSKLVPEFKLNLDIIDVAVCLCIYISMYTMICLSKCRNRIGDTLWVFNNINNKNTPIMYFLKVYSAIVVLTIYDMQSEEKRGKLPFVFIYY